VERRKHPRFKVRVEARLALGPERLRGHLRDICRDAALVEVDRSVSPGSEVALELDLPGGGDPLRAVGQVVREASEDGSHVVAVLFDDLNPAAETRIEFFVLFHSHEG
jgi:hypothetical protein